MMTRFILMATIVSLSIVKADVAHAQAAVSEPGAYAFYHPDGDVLRAGPQYGAPSGVANALASAPVGSRTVRRHRR
jgi:hypothetical protein